MAACGAGVNANNCIATCRKFVEACDFHFFAAPAYRQFSAAGNQQTFKCGHSPSPRFSRRDLTQRRNRHSRFWPPARQASAKPGPFQSGTPSGEDRWFRRASRRHLAAYRWQSLATDIAPPPKLEWISNARRVLFREHSKQKRPEHNRRATLEVSSRRGMPQPPAHPDPRLLSPARILRGFVLRGRKVRSS